MKLVIFGGTTEGRQLAERAADLGFSVTVSVATAYGVLVLPKRTSLRIQEGRLNQVQMIQFLREEAPDAVFDATHPYAEAVTDTVFAACEELSLSYYRIHREEEHVEAEGIVSVQSVQEAVDYLRETDGNILITTGSKELAAFTALPAFAKRCYVRVLPSQDALQAVTKLGFDTRHVLAMQGPFSEESNIAFLHQTQSHFLVTKSSGKEGGFSEKIHAAQKTGAVAIVIERKEIVQGTTAHDADTEKENHTDKIMHLQEAFFWLANNAGGKQKKEVFLIGMGPGNVSFLSEEAIGCLKSCDMLLGSQRMLKEAGEITGDCINQFASTRKEELLTYLNTQDSWQKAGILYSGDVGVYSGAKGMEELLSQRYDVKRLPGISSVTCFLARLGLSLEDVQLISCHGQDGNLLSAVRTEKKVCALLGGKMRLSEVCRKLQDFGFRHLTLTVGERLSYPDERVVKGTVTDFLDTETDSLAILLIENPDASAGMRLPGIEDAQFIRRAVPMTKEEIRVISLAKLRLSEDSILYDIGSGSGSVGIEAALFCRKGHVYAIEKKEDAWILTSENAKKLQADHLTPICGKAPEAFEQLPCMTHAFIGGSSGNLREIVDALLLKNPDVRIVINAVTAETLTQILALQKEVPQAIAMEIIQVQVTSFKEKAGYHMQEAGNPIWVASFGAERRVR